MLKQKSKLQSPGICAPLVPGGLVGLNSANLAKHFSEDPWVKPLHIQTCTTWFLNSPVDADPRTDIHRISMKGAMAMNSLKQISKSLSFLSLLAIMLLLCSHLGRAQELAATLSGLVADSSGAVIPNASISIALNGVNPFYLPHH